MIGMIAFVMYLLFTCTCLSAGEYEIQQIIASIPEKDVQDIQSLFRTLFKTQTFRVGFVCDPNCEVSSRLIEKYDDLSREINEIYSKDDWFVQTLIQLSSD